MGSRNLHLQATDRIVDRDGRISLGFQRKWQDLLVQGYLPGRGGTVTQATSKATAVELNKPCGQITLNAASLAAATAVSFTLTNSEIAAGDVLILNHAGGGTFGAYMLDARAADGSATIAVRNLTAGALAEAVVIGFALIKATTT